MFLLKKKQVEDEEGSKRKKKTLGTLVGRREEEGGKKKEEVGSLNKTMKVSQAKEVTLVAEKCSTEWARNSDILLSCSVLLRLTIRKLFDPLPLLLLLWRPLNSSRGSPLSQAPSTCDKSSLKLPYERA